MRNIVVFGAGRPGYGQATALRLQQDGYSIQGTFDNDYADEGNEFAAQNPSMNLIELDHSDLGAVEEYLASIKGPLAGLVVAEFYFAMEDPNNFDLAQWNRSLAVNLTLPKLAFHGLIEKFDTASSTVFVTSTEGFIGSFGAHAYASTKAATHNLVKSLANIAGAKQVRVNAVAAGWIGGVMDTDEVFNMSRRITPLARLGEAKEIAGVVSFLLGGDSSFVNGSTVTADGGYSGVDTISKYEFDHEFEQD
ncbi:SDR family NAD(P)-dependent oxidoreductase [Glycomyces tritici]|uniref:SDR family oxidoreductase n=1 Tax=Glycomyces tritici TaxID=2665176 RepID=A0ABT7YQJ1_9ACTN|nr:SDR family oxidoreductase [Glycomyces tritici]MDN3240884.1 SDR family oxidoreductase [Glycomyces tritici]MDN3242913.1 SDR family oxidoreductase [Glycomyces tritici]